MFIIPDRTRTSISVNHYHHNVYKSILRYHKCCYMSWMIERMREVNKVWQGNTFWYLCSVCYDKDAAARSQAAPSPSTKGMGFLEASPVYAQDPTIIERKTYSEGNYVDVYVCKHVLMRALIDPSILKQSPFDNMMRLGWLGKI